jgi:hypothetical protein
MEITLLRGFLFCHVGVVEEKKVGGKIEMICGVGGLRHRRLSGG